jgi:hypothetical protein
MTNLCFHTFMRLSLDQIKRIVVVNHFNDTARQKRVIRV